MKTCTACLVEKPIKDFNKHKKTKDNLQSWCKSCQKKLSVNTNRQRYTGCTPEEFNTLYIKQKGCCAICGKHASEFERALAADHCHTNKNIRGLLCMNCNSGLGKFKDNPELLLKAALYLQEP